MVNRCVMQRAWTHKFQSSGPTVYSLYCAQTVGGMHPTKLGTVYMRPGPCQTGIKIEIYLLIYCPACLCCFSVTAICRACVGLKHRAQLRPV